MKITLIPETPEEEVAIRKRAVSESLVDSLAKYLDQPTVLRAAQEWVGEHPQPPKPGSIVRHNETKQFRVVRDDGYLMTINGVVGRGPDRWSVGDGADDYTVIFDMREKS